MATEYLDVLVEENQNLRDVCLQVYGSLDYLLKFARENGLPNGVNENIRPGQKLVYEKLSPLKDFDAASVQQIYDDRAIRVVTGDVNSRPRSECTIPEGYVLFSFQWIEVVRDFVAFLTNEECIPQEELTLAQISSYAFYENELKDTYNAAYLFAQWVNNYYGSLGYYATNSSDKVNIYIPKGLARCGDRLSMCLYWRRPREMGADFGERPLSDILLFDIPTEDRYTGLTRCCSTLIDIDETYNQSTK